MSAAHLIYPERVQNPQERRRQQATEKHEPQHGQGRPPVWGPSKYVGLIAVVLAALTLCSCDLARAVADNVHTLRVVNLCTGSNYTVDVYVNGRRLGTVTYSGQFMVFTGSATLVAVGTGPNPLRFERSTYVSRDLQWTLCTVSSGATPSRFDPTEIPPGGPPTYSDSLDEAE